MGELNGRLLASIVTQDLGTIADCPRCGRPCRLLDFGAGLMRVEEVGRTSHGTEILFVIHCVDRCSARPRDVSVETWIGGGHVERRTG